MKMIQNAINTLELAQLLDSQHNNTVRMLKVVSEQTGKPLTPVKIVSPEGSPRKSTQTAYVMDSVTAATVATRQNPHMAYALFTHVDAFKDVTNSTDFKALFRLILSMIVNK